MFITFHKQWVAVLAVGCVIFVGGCGSAVETESDRKDLSDVAATSQQGSTTSQSAAIVGSPEDALTDSSHVILQEGDDKVEPPVALQQNPATVVKHVPETGEHVPPKPVPAQRDIIRQHQSLLQHTKYYSPKYTKGIGFCSDDEATCHFVDISQEHWNNIKAAPSLTPRDAIQAAQGLINVLEKGGNTVMINNRAYTTDGKLDEGGQAFIYLIRDRNNSFIVKIDKEYFSQNAEHNAIEIIKKADEECMLHQSLLEDVPNNTVAAWNYNVAGCFVTLKPFAKGLTMTKMLEQGTFRFDLHGRNIERLLSNISLNRRAYADINGANIIWPPSRNTFIVVDAKLPVSFDSVEGAYRKNIDFFLDKMAGTMFTRARKKAYTATGNGKHLPKHMSKAQKQELEKLRQALREKRRR